MSLSTDKIALDEYYCPIAGTVMGKPMILSCCRQNLDQETINAILARKSPGTTEIPCPLCRRVLEIITVKGSEKNKASSPVSRQSQKVCKIQGLILNKNLKQKIDQWVNEKPAERRKLVCKASDFPDPSTIQQEAPSEDPFDPFSNPSEEEMMAGAIIVPVHIPTGLIEALLQSENLLPTPTHEVAFALGARFEPENSSPKAKKIRDFLTVFNAIWTEIPGELRPNFRTDSQKKLFQIVKEWLVKPEAKLALSKVTALNLPGLKLATLPTELALLSSLEFLDISGNMLTTIPINPSLRWLNLRNNRISIIKSNIALLDKLEVLYLGQNPIEHLSREIVKIKKLRHLELTSISPKFQGLHLNFADFFGRIVCRKEHLDKLVNMIKSLTNDLIEAANRFKKDDEQQAFEIFKRVPAPSQKRVRALVKLLQANLQHHPGLSALNFELHKQPLILTAVSYIAWLYFHGFDDVAEKLFLKLPEGFRNEAYRFVYKENLRQFALDKRKDLECGKKAFLRVKGYHIDGKSRFDSLVSVGEKVLKEMIIKLSLAP